MTGNTRNRQYIVVGLGRFGSAIAETLSDAGEEVLGIDQDMELVEDMRDRITRVVQLNAMDRDALEALGVSDFDVAFVTMGSDITASGTITLMLKELGVKQVIAKAHDDFHGRMLEKLGADSVLFPERDMGRRIAHNMMSGNIVDYIELSKEYSIAEVAPLPEWIGRPLRELALRSSAGVNIIAIRSGEEVNAMPGESTCIRQGDVLLVVAREDTLAKMYRRG